MLALSIFALAAAAEPDSATPAETETAPTSAPADGAPLRAATTALFPIRAVNLSPAEVRAAEILFRRRFELATRGPTLPEPAVQTAVSASDHDGLLAACDTLGCTRWVTVDLVRLDREIFVIAIEHDATGGVLQRVETSAVGLDALGRTLDRVARALVRDLPLAEVVEDPSFAAPPASTPVASAVPVPTSRPRATAADRDTLGFKMGLHGPLWPNFQLALSTTFTYRQNIQANFFEGNVGFTLPLGLSDDRAWGMLFAEVGLFHHFLEREGLALYAGGGLGPRIGGYDDLGFGVGVYGATGAAFGPRNRAHAYTHLKVGGDAFTSLYSPYVVGYAGLEAGVGF